MVEKGQTIKFKDGLKYEVLKVFDTGHADLKSKQPLFEWMPDFYPVFYSIKLKDYEIIN